LFILFATLQLVVFLGGDAWRELSGSETLPSTLIFGGAVVAPLTALYVGLLRHAPQERTGMALRLGTAAAWQGGMVLLAMVAGTALAPVAADTIARMIEVFPLDASEGVDDPSPFMFITLVVIGFPLVTELFFRGFMQMRLARTVGMWRAWAIASL